MNEELIIWSDIFCLKKILERQDNIFCSQIIEQHFVGLKLTIDLSSYYTFSSVWTDDLVYQMCAESFVLSKSKIKKLYQYIVK